jgi:hypothetical protein
MVCNAGQVSTHRYVRWPDHMKQAPAGCKKKQLPHYNPANLLEPH